MNPYLTQKGAEYRRRDWPVMIASGVLTVLGVRAVAEIPPEDPVIWAIAAALFLAMMSAPLWLVLRRRIGQRRARALANCLQKSRESMLTFGEVERRTGLRDAETKLQQAVAKGYLQNILVDTRMHCVRLAVDTGAAPAEVRPEPADTGSAEFNEKLKEIRRMNDEIDHKAVSDKIDRIEALTADIFQLIVEKPERAAEARRFMNYYLPTTMKLLESYRMMEKQRYQGGNIRASRAQIESVLDSIIEAIERQEDKLFQSDALDVETDIAVLKTMMTADGLTEDGRLQVEA